MITSESRVFPSQEKAAEDEVRDVLKDKRRGEKKI